MVAAVVAVRAEKKSMKLKKEGEKHTKEGNEKANEEIVENVFSSKIFIHINSFNVYLSLSSFFL